MFRKFLTIAVAVAAVSLGACATTNPDGTPRVGGGVAPILAPTGSPQIDEFVVKVQDFAIQACGFQPTAATITGILSTFIPGAVPINALATQITTGICSAVTKKGFRRGGAAPSYRGVKISGTRVR
jgi:hypothetical protein